MTDKVERPYGKYTTPQALIAGVKMQYYNQDQHQKDIAGDIGVSLSTVLGILAESWGEAEWYLNGELHREVVELEGGKIKSEPRGAYNVDHANATLHCRVIGRDKAGWVKRAQKAGVSLAAWVVQQLNAGADLKGKYKGMGDDEDPLLGLQQHCEEACEAISHQNTVLNTEANRSEKVGVHLVITDNLHAQVACNRMRFLIGQMVKDRAAGWRFCIDHLVKPEHPCPICDMNRLITHIAVMGIELRDGAEVVDQSTESFRSLPDHLQLAINVAGDVLEPNGET